MLLYVANNADDTKYNYDDCEMHETCFNGFIGGGFMISNVIYVLWAASVVGYLCIALFFVNIKDECAKFCHTFLNIS